MPGWNRDSPPRFGGYAGVGTPEARIAASIDSAALRGDAACSITCAYMAGALLAGLVLTTIAGWRWADSVAALALLYWLGREAHEVLAGARAGHGACACDG